LRSALATFPSPLGRDRPRQLAATSPAESAAEIHPRHAKLGARLAELGGTPIPGSPADFGKLVAEDIEKWAKVVKFAGIKPE
jgi:hypothetical protein